MVQNPFMRRQRRLAMHLLVIITMIAATLLAPVHTATYAWRKAVSSQTVTAVSEMPSGDTEAPTSSNADPSCCKDCCCSQVRPATACLLGSSRLIVTVLAATLPMARNAPAPPSRLLDTLLRPPIS